MPHTNAVWHELPFPLLQVDAKGYVLQANAQAEECLNTSLRQLQRRPFWDWFHAPDDVQRLLHKVWDAESMQGMARLRHVPKTYALHVRNEGAALMLMLVDETQRQIAEEQYHQQVITDTVARIALEMAHEVKNPLAALRASAQWLSESATGQDLEIAQHMLGETDRIKARIDHFLQLGPRADTQMQDCNIHALIDAVILPESQALSARVQRQFDPSIPNLLLHANRMRQALENLWRNALEAGASYICWQTRIAKPDVHLPGYHGGIVEILIRNDGKPIPNDLRTQIFEPFITSKQRGSGLGLAIVQRVVQEHGGRLSMNASDSYTEFRICLPLKRGQA